jgi:hypothetical protein
MEERVESTSAEGKINGIVGKFAEIGSHHKTIPITPTDIAAELLS